jgi:hypothetical protein
VSGIIATFGLGPGSNVAKVLFVILAYTCSLFSKMIMSSTTGILVHGLIEERMGLKMLWSQ